MMERWQQIQSLFQRALERDPAERNAWLREACQGDSDLRREVASLLANHQAASDSKPWAAAAAAKLIDNSASLEPGHCLGPYRIEGFLAAGGMGKVYRATDTRLHRQVAIKVASAHFSERFEREARVIASLNHPNICQLHDVGPNYLVMEFVEGPTLAERTRKGALQLDEALVIGRQIAEALEAAHEKGIVHRDLKPANVKVTSGGVAKVLDFGLAKATEEPAATGNLSDSPTQTMSATRVGVILGTAAYMSPEQVRGAAVDKRADIWAFGCVLYEMLSGKAAFRGETTTDILAAVLRAEPAWNTLRPGTPPRIRKLLRRCLERDRKQRLQAIGEARIAIDAPEDAVTPWPIPSRVWPWATALGVALCLSAVAWLRSPPPDTRPLARLSAELPPGTEIPNNASGNGLAVSPDGMRLAIIEQDEAGMRHLATRRLDEDQVVPLSGTEGASRPFFSPDGQWVGFFADGKLKKIAVQGGAPATLCKAELPTYGASWGDDGNIIAAFNGGGAGLLRISSAGGSQTPVAGLDIAKDVSASDPQVLPGSNAVLFQVLPRGGSPDDAEIDVFSFRTGRRKTLQRNGFFPRYLASGHLAYMHQGTLYAAPFDLNRLEVTGVSQPVLEDVSLAGLSATAHFDCSASPSGSGTCVYLKAEGENSLAVFWLDSAGKVEPLEPSPSFYVTPRFSPDGKRLAFSKGNGQARQHDIWVQDLDGNGPSRLTRLPGINSSPVWTPDSVNLVFESILGASPSLYWIRADGTSEAQRLTDDKVRRIPYSFTPDGNRLAYTQRSAGQSEIWTAPIERDAGRVRLGKPELFLRTTSVISARLSPNGRWMAYQMDETGRYEVYVSPFPGHGRRRQISTEGGWFPIWSRNSDELFFLTPNWRIMVAGYTAKGELFTPGKLRVWSEKRLLRMPAAAYDLGPEGKRFAVVLAADGTAGPTTHLTVLLNFFDELRRRVPPGGR
jgi:serine/threonine-protein kinase